MTAAPRVASPPAEPELVITRVFDAPRELVFRAWTEPEHFVRWWGPNGFTTPVCKIDLRPGGVWHVCMRSPDGRDYWSKGVYREIVAPERIVSTDFFSDAAGHRVPPAQYGLPADWPAEMLLTVTFAEQDGGTRLTVRQSVPEALARSIGAVEGWNQSFDRLAEQLANA